MKGIKIRFPKWKTIFGRHLWMSLTVCHRRANGKKKWIELCYKKVKNSKSPSNSSEFANTYICFFVFQLGGAYFKRVFSTYLTFLGLHFHGLFLLFEECIVRAHNSYFDLLSCLVTKKVHIRKFLCKLSCKNCILLYCF